MLAPVFSCHCQYLHGAAHISMQRKPLLRRWRFLPPSLDRIWRKVPSAFRGKAIPIGPPWPVTFQGGQEE